MVDESTWEQASPLILSSAAATQSLAALLGQIAVLLSLPQPAKPTGSSLGWVILLDGDLGSGKTTFVQGLGQGLGISEPIDSPTFVLVQEYHTGQLPLFHCDLYRLESAPAQALEDLGLEELWSQPGITAIEWPQYLHRLPASYLWLSLRPHPDQEKSRLLYAKGKGSQAAQLWQQVLSRFTQQDTQQDVQQNIQEEGLRFSS